MAYYKAVSSYCLQCSKNTEDINTRILKTKNNDIIKICYMQQ